MGEKCYEFCEELLWAVSNLLSLLFATDRLYFPRPSDGDITLLPGRHVKLFPPGFHPQPPAKALQARSSLYPPG